MINQQHFARRRSYSCPPFCRAELFIATSIDRSLSLFSALNLDVNWFVGDRFISRVSKDQESSGEESHGSKSSPQSHYSLSSPRWSLFDESPDGLNDASAEPDSLSWRTADSPTYPFNTIFASESHSLHSASEEEGDMTNSTNDAHSLQSHTEEENGKTTFENESHSLQSDSEEEGDMTISENDANSLQSDSEEEEDKIISENDGSSLQSDDEEDRDKTISENNANLPHSDAENEEGELPSMETDSDEVVGNHSERSTSKKRPIEEIHTKKAKFRRSY